MVEEFNKQRTQNIRQPEKGYASTHEQMSQMPNKNTFIGYATNKIWG